VKGRGGGPAASTATLGHDPDPAVGDLILPVRFHPVRGAFLVALLLVPLALAGTARGQDADGDGLGDGDESVLAIAHAPILYFHPRETYFPTPVAYALDTGVLERYVSEAQSQLVDATPTAAELAAYATPADPATNPGDVVYLNNTRGSVRDDTGIHAAVAGGSYPDTVYVRATPDSGFTVVQYWFYYAFNPGTWNRHEGDWETVEVVLSGGEPSHAGYSQHRSGERMAWSDVERDGDHPKVYVARGSHANYLRAYAGRFGIAGDEVSDAGAVWRPGDYALVNVGELAAPSPGQEWLRFAGRWGEFSLGKETRAESAPPGPGYREAGTMFSMPTQWADALPVPNALTLTANWLLTYLVGIFLLVLLVSIALTLVRMWRVQRRTKAGFRMWPYAHLRPFDRKSAALLVAVAGIAVGLVGLLLPWYLVTADVDAPGFLVTNGPTDILRVDGVTGVTINPLQDGTAVRVDVLPIPIGLFLIATSGYFFLRITGTRTSKGLGGKFAGRGVVAVLPFAFVVLVVAALLPALPADDPGQVGYDDFLRAVAASPFGGSTTIAVAGGSATLTWGLAIGSWILIASAVLMFVAAGLAASSSYKFLPPPTPKEPEGPGPAGPP